MHAAAKNACLALSWWKSDSRGLERLLYLDFDAANELGDKVRLSLVIEIMGKYSNIILVDGQGKIVDALKRVDEEMSSQRLVQPGLAYELPPAQNKALYAGVPAGGDCRGYCSSTEEPKPE